MPTAFVPKETVQGESRVALLPDAAKRLAGLGLEVLVEAGAGAGARASDADYQKAGAKTAGREAWSQADLVLKVQPPSLSEAALLKRGAVLVSFVYPAANRALVE